MPSISTGVSDRGGSATTTGKGQHDEQYELADYTHITARREDDAKAARTAAKRVEKCRWLDAQDEMKFSHSIQFNAVPDWSSHYIAYSNLKKLCVVLFLSHHASRAIVATRR